MQKILQKDKVLMQIMLSIGSTWFKLIKVLEATSIKYWFL